MPAENLHYIADAAQAAYLGDHPERATQHLPQQQQQQPGAAPPQQPGDYTGGWHASLACLKRPVIATLNESKFTLDAPTGCVDWGLQASAVQIKAHVRVDSAHSRASDTARAGTTALGAPVELPPNGEAAHGVPVDMRSQPAEANHDA